MQDGSPPACEGGPLEAPPKAKTKPSGFTSVQNIVEFTALADGIFPAFFRGFAADYRETLSFG